MSNPRLRRLIGRRAGIRFPAPSTAGANLSYAGAVVFNADGFTFEDSDATAVAWGTNQNVDSNGTPQNNYDQTDVVYVKRRGFSGVNVAAEPVDAVRVMSRFRKRYAGSTPNHTEWEDVDTAANPDAVRAVLNEFIYSDDTIFGADGAEDAITNNSTLDYPLAIPRWLNAPYTRVSGSDKIYLFVDHAYARNGKPVAGVRISLSDGTTTITVDATDMVKKAYTASGKTAPCYEFAPDWSALDDDTLITIDALIYPHVGDIYQASVDGSNTDHTANFGVLRVWNTSATLRYFYVDPTSPSGSPVTSTTPATAAAAPFANIVAGLTQAQTDSGGTLANVIGRLVEDTHVLSDISGFSITDAGIVIESAPGAAAANVVLRHEVANDDEYLADIMHIRDLSMDHHDSVSNFRWGSDATKGSKNYLCLENILGVVSGAITNFSFSDTGIVTCINCSGENLKVARSANTIEANFYGCAGAWFYEPGAKSASSTYNIVACSNFGESTAFVFSNQTADTLKTAEKIGQVCAFSELSSGEGSDAIIVIDGVVGVRGISLSGNVGESWGTHAAQGTYANADDNQSATQNLVCRQFTFVGDDSVGRFNWLYAPASSVTVIKRGFLGNGILANLNTKTDIYDTNGASLGNESEFYRVGDGNLMVLDAGVNSDYFGPGNWMGEVRPLNTTDGQAGTQDPGFQDDQSNGGGDAGDGDYRPTIADMANDLVPAVDVRFLCDLNGTNWALDGSDAKGALAAV